MGCDQTDLDSSIYISYAQCEKWHTPRQVYAMKPANNAANGKWPAARNKHLRIAGQLVETSSTQKTACKLENCLFILIFWIDWTLENGPWGIFRRGYTMLKVLIIHNLLVWTLDKENGYQEMWRLREKLPTRVIFTATDMDFVHLSPDLWISITVVIRWITVTSVLFQWFSDEKGGGEVGTGEGYVGPEFASKNYVENMNTTVVKTAWGKDHHDPTWCELLLDLNSSSSFARSTWYGRLTLKNIPDRKDSKGERLEWRKRKWMNWRKKVYTWDCSKVGLNLANGSLVWPLEGMDLYDGLEIGLTAWEMALPLDQMSMIAALWSCISPLSEMVCTERDPTLIDVPDFNCW